MIKPLLIDFYRLTVNDAGVLFSGLLRRASGLPLAGSDRTVKIDHVPYRLEEVHHNVNPERWEGNISRIRMNDLPGKGSLTAPSTSLPLATNEGVSEETAFMYIPSRRIVVLQRGKQGVSYRAFSNYFEKLFALQSGVQLDPVLRPDVDLTLRSMTSVKMLDVVIARTDNPAFLAELRPSLGGLVDLISETGGRTVQLRLSMGHSKGSMVVQRVVDKVGELLDLSQTIDDGRSKRRFRKIEMKGETPNSDHEALDLLQARMFETLSVDMGGDRRMSYPKRKAALRVAWGNRSDDINRMFTTGE